MILGIKEIQEIIPHRYPFLLIDRIEELEEGKRVVAYKNVTFNEYFFQGHFPQEPVMPGVLVIEALAQAGAVALLKMKKFKGKTGYFTGIDRARIRRKVIPGDILKLEAEIIKLKGPAGVAKALATVEGQTAVEAQLMFFIG